MHKIEGMVLIWVLGLMVLCMLGLAMLMQILYADEATIHLVQQRQLLRVAAQNALEEIIAHPEKLQACLLPSIDNATLLQAPKSWWQDRCELPTQQIKFFFVAQVWDEDEGAHKTSHLNKLLRVSYMAYYKHVQMLRQTMILTKR